MLNIDLSGRRALVTGSSSGLGESIAMALSDAGARVAIHYRKARAAADAVVDRIARQGGTAQAFQADISVPEEVVRLFAEIGAAFGGLDVLVNNAGMDGGSANCADGDPDQWARVIAVNLQGPYYCTRQALHSMLPQKRGVIINITSVHEFIPW